jgi:zinc D-Ala-D-Ala carboxypeptidase
VSADGGGERELKESAMKALHVLAKVMAIACVAALPLYIHVSTAAAYAWPRTLSMGMRGVDVAELQIRIAGWAADVPSHSYLAIDGVYGPATAAAVRRVESAYGLRVDAGIAGPQVFGVLNSLEKPDRSTAHFSWAEFMSHDGSGFSGGKVPVGEVRENIRRLMWKLEALRHKLDGHPIIINSGFRSIAQNRRVGGASNSMHMYGVAADIRVAGYHTCTVHHVAETTGFSGLETCHASWQHVDSRIEYPYGSQSWWWQ